MEIVSRFTPMMEPVSIDEAYADVTGCTTLFGPPQVIARKIKHLIFNDLSLTCSIGIAPVKFLAKIASDMNKPDGLTFITREQMPQMILTLPIRKVPGVGKQAMARMTELNIQTLGDIQRFGLSLLTRKFGKFGHRLFELSRGIDNDPVRTETTRKSISNEITLEKDISDAGAAQRILLSLAGRVGRELRQKQLTSESVFIKIKFPTLPRSPGRASFRTGPVRPKRFFPGPGPVREGEQFQAHSPSGRGSLPSACAK